MKGLDVKIIPGSATESCSDELDEMLQASGAELICLCGYLRRFRVGELWRGKVVNIHPALLPNFGGKGMFGNRVHQAVLDSDEKESGCTVHWVDEAYDQGEIILQHRCEVRRDDDKESLAKRVFEAECLAYPQALELVASKLQTPSSLCES
jgi:phosphoribosylglycinamide formyltransferase-1